MTKEEHTQIIESIRTAENDVDRNKLLVSLVNDYDTVLAERTTALEQVETLSKENTEYAKLNNQLFLQLGNQNLTQNEPTPNTPPTEPPQKLSYDSLTFDN